MPINTLYIAAHFPNPYLALQQTSKKYGPAGGELMLVHECQECGKISLNRIAAEDVAENLYEIFHDSCAGGLHARLKDSGLRILGLEDEAVVERLLGIREN